MLEKDVCGQDCVGGKSLCSTHEKEHFESHEHYHKVQALVKSIGGSFQPTAQLKTILAGLELEASLRVEHSTEYFGAEEEGHKQYRVGCLARAERLRSLIGMQEHIETQVRELVNSHFSYAWQKLGIVKY